MSVQKTNSYKKYFEILDCVDNNKGLPVTVDFLAELLRLSNKQTLRCMNEIVSIDGRYKLTKVGRWSAIIKKD